MTYWLIGFAFGIVWWRVDLAIRRLEERVFVLEIHAPPSVVVGGRQR